MKKTMLCAVAAAVGLAGEVRAQTNNTPINIPASGNATPFGSTISVSGVTGGISQVVVQLNTLSHPNPQDLDILLVSPQGDSVQLLSDAGGTSSVSNLNLFFDELAASGVAAGGPLVSGTYFPSTYGLRDDPYGLPAMHPTDVGLTTFFGRNPNGTWRLYVRDDNAGTGGTGVITTWSLSVFGGQANARPTLSAAPALALPAFNEDTFAHTGSTVASLVSPGMADADLWGVRGMAVTTAAMTSGVWQYSQDNGGTWVDIFNIPAGGALLLPADLNTRLRFVGSTNFNGSPAPLTFRAWDRTAGNPWSVIDSTNAALNTAVSVNSDDVTVVVNPVNDAPTLAGVFARSTAEDTPLTFNVTMNDVDNAAANLNVTGTSSNQAIVADGGITVTRAGSIATVNIIPVGDAFGQTTITLTVSDGQLSTPVPFVLTVTGVDDRPYVYGLPPTLPVVLPEDTQTSVSFTYAEPDNDMVTITATAVAAADQAIWGTGNLPMAYFGGNATLGIRPLANAFGTGTIRVTVSDPQGMSTSALVTATVTAVDDAPTMAHPSSVSMTEDTPSTINVTLADVDNDPATITFTAQGTAGRFSAVASGSGATRSVLLTPLPNVFGNGTLTLTAVSGSQNVSVDIPVTIGAVNDLPTISTLADQVTSEDTPVTINAMVGDVETAAAMLTVTAQVAGHGTATVTNLNGALAITYTPGANEFSPVTVTVTVTDANGATANDSFSIQVTPINDPPTLAPISPAVTDEDQTVDIPLTASDVETPADSLVFEVVPSDTTLVPLSNALVMRNPLALRVTPGSNQHGNTTITVTVSDGEFVATRTVDLNVGSVDDPPTVVAPADTTMSAGTSQTLSFEVLDPDSAVETFAVSAAASNDTLFPPGSITVSGTTQQRNILLQPAGSLTGSATITLTLATGFDAGAGATDSFLVTVASGGGSSSGGGSGTVSSGSNSSTQGGSSGMVASSAGGSSAGGSTSTAGSSGPGPSSAGGSSTGAGSSSVMTASSEMPASGATSTGGGDDGGDNSRGCNSLTVLGGGLPFPALLLGLVLVLLRRRRR